MNEKQREAVILADHLVGNLYMDLSAVPLIAGMLQPRAMPDTPAADVYNVMCELFRNPEVRLSAGSVEAELKQRDFNFDYIGNLQKRIILDDISVLYGYAQKISDAFALREVDRLAGAAQALARSGTEGAATITANLTRELSMMDEGSGGFVSIGDTVGEAIDEVEAWRRGELIDGIKTGFTNLDKIVSLRNGEFIVVAARPSMGKSAFAFQIAYKVAAELKAQNKPGCVAIFSAEMNKRSVAHRISAAIASVNDHRLRERIASAQEYADKQRGLEHLRTLPIEIDDDSSPTTEEIFYRASMLHVKKPIRLLIFDFMEMGGNRERSEELRISRIAKDLKNIAKFLNIPVMALSQLNRDIEKRASKMPALADLRYSGNIEAVSDVVLFLLRPEYYIKRGDTQVFRMAGKDREHAEGVAYAIVAKHRNGPVGTVPLAFIERYAKFGNLAC
ncbi:MAG: AAA family ATPase [Planctomycetaceae bacterium]|nr:AAA family ATPase [Planctomycetaceae bacterium]